MENAVPIVTQAPGAQPLQIQPGLLAQVMSSEDPKQRRLFCVLFSSWKLERVAFSEGLLCCSLEKWAAIKSQQLYLKCLNLTQFIVLLLHQSCKWLWKDCLFFFIEISGDLRGGCVRPLLRGIGRNLPGSFWTCNLNSNFCSCAGELHAAEKHFLCFNFAAFYESYLCSWVMEEM